MEWIFLIMLLGAATYAGVEYMKHFYPSWWDKQNSDAKHYLHDKVDEVLAEVKKLTEGK